MVDYKRQVAIKSDIFSLANGKFVKEDGLKPSYVLTDNNEKISRASIMAVVVSVESESENTQAFTIDDGSSKISVRIFQDTGIKYRANIGDTVHLIGKPREYNSEKYIVPEIIKIITDDRWLKVRRIELGKKPVPQKKIGIKDEPKIETEEEVVSTKEEITPSKVYNFIKEKDTGNGTDFSEIIEHFRDEKTETMINTLLQEGEIFEITPGKLKSLE